MGSFFYRRNLNFKLQLTPIGYGGTSRVFSKILLALSTRSSTLGLHTDCSTTLFLTCQARCISCGDQSPQKCNPTNFLLAPVLNGSATDSIPFDSSHNSSVSVTFRLEPRPRNPQSGKQEWRCAKERLMCVIVLDCFPSRYSDINISNPCSLTFLLQDFRGAQVAQYQLPTPFRPRPHRRTTAAIRSPRSDISSFPGVVESPYSQHNAWFYRGNGHYYEQQQRPEIIDIIPRSGCTLGAQRVWIRVQNLRQHDRSHLFVKFGPFSNDIQPRFLSPEYDTFQILELETPPHPAGEVYPELRSRHDPQTQISSSPMALTYIYNDLLALSWKVSHFPFVSRHLTFPP
jgi:hypothetical protein